jgi:hypothetical protein
MVNICWRIKKVGFLPLLQITKILLFPRNQLIIDTGKKDKKGLSCPTGLS